MAFRMEPPKDDRLGTDKRVRLYATGSGMLYLQVQDPEGAWYSVFQLAPSGDMVLWRVNADAAGLGQLETK